MHDFLQSTYSAVFTAIIGAGLALISGHTTLFISLISIILVLLTIDRHRPSYKFSRLENTIRKIEDLLLQAEESCLMHWHGDVVELKVRLFRAKLAAAKIEAEFMTHKIRNPTAFLRILTRIPDTLKSKTEIFEALQQIPTSIKEYVQTRWQLTQRINRCAHEVKEIEKSIRILSMNERGRLILQGVREAEGIATNNISVMQLLELTSSLGISARRRHSANRHAFELGQRQRPGKRDMNDIEPTVSTSSMPNNAAAPTPVGATKELIARMQRRHMPSGFRFAVE
ncbi:hypothetical protein R3P38DRAFT_2814368 [Favolaschia claudopus]|uniref:ATP synthase protein MI25 n=1 Tax=Favolaschia claudopus TaxID=2862362 RepID=A0AAV9Z393_9AGAR